MELSSRPNRADSSAQKTMRCCSCVPDWHFSALKSSEQILNRFGYERGGEFRLYCEVSTSTINSQGLHLRLDEAQRWLREVFAREPPEEVAVWQMSRLEERLQTKHIWISVRATGGPAWRRTVRAHIRYTHEKF